jgi:hypothetical protein
MLRRTVENVRNCAGGLDTGGTRTNDDEVQATLCRGPSRYVRRLEQLKNLIPSITPTIKKIKYNGAACSCFLDSLQIAFAKLL